MTVKRIIIGNDFMQTIDDKGSLEFTKITNDLSDRELSGRRPDSYHPDNHTYVTQSSVLPVKLQPDYFGQPVYDPTKSWIPLHGRHVLVHGIGKVKVLKAAEDNKWIQFIHPRSGEKTTIYGMDQWEVAQKISSYDINDEAL